MASIMRFDQWEDSNGVPVLNGTGLAIPSSALPAGSIIAVKSAIFDGTQSASLAAGGNVAITGLSITHEVANPANKLIITGSIGVLGNSAEQGQGGLAVNDGSGFIAVGASPGSRTAVSTGGRSASGAGSSEVAIGFSTCFVHTPGAGSKTYTLHAFNVRGDTRTVYVNRTNGDTNAGQSPRGISSLVIQEVAV
jgi:hypothetical protein